MNWVSEFLREEFSENMVDWGFPEIFLIILQIVLVLWEEPN